jgi:AcrR family transcriptional regulator
LLVVSFGFIFVSNYSLIAMTEKQKAILNVALQLFAERGFNAVPTSLIAKEAGVSEGLIFRHFQNKVGLLDAIMQLGMDNIAEQMDELSKIENPEELIQQIMEMPFHISETEFPFWRLVYSLKWQTAYYNDEMSKPIKILLIKALAALKYNDVEMEANLIMSYIDGFATTILLKGNQVNKQQLLATLKKKYNPTN